MRGNIVKKKKKKRLKRFEGVKSRTERQRQREIVKRYMALGAATLAHGYEHENQQKAKNRVHNELHTKVRGRASIDGPRTAVLFRSLRKISEGTEVVFFFFFFLLAFSPISPSKKKYPDDEMDAEEMSRIQVRQRSASEALTQDTPLDSPNPAAKQQRLPPINIPLSTTDPVDHTAEREKKYDIKAILFFFFHSVFETIGSLVDAKEREGATPMSPPPSTATPNVNATSMDARPLVQPTKQGANGTEADTIELEQRSRGTTKILSKHLRCRQMDNAIELLQNAHLREVSLHYYYIVIFFVKQKKNKSISDLCLSLNRHINTSKRKRQLFEERLMKVINNPPNPNLYVNLELLTKRQRVITPHTLLPFHQLDALPKLLDTLRNDLTSANGNALIIFNAHKNFLFGILSLHGVFDPNAKAPSPPRTPSFSSRSDSPSHSRSKKDQSRSPSRSKSKPPPDNDNDNDNNPNPPRSPSPQPSEDSDSDTQGFPMYDFDLDIDVDMKVSPHPSIHAADVNPNALSDHSCPTQHCERHIQITSPSHHIFPPPSLSPCKASKKSLSAFWNGNNPCTDYNPSLSSEDESSRYINDLPLTDMGTDTDIDIDIDIDINIDIETKTGTNAEMIRVNHTTKKEDVLMESATSTQGIGNNANIASPLLKSHNCKNNSKQLSITNFQILMLMVITIVTIALSRVSDVHVVGHTSMHWWRFGIKKESVYTNSTADDLLAHLEAGSYACANHFQAPLSSSIAVDTISQCSNHLLNQNVNITSSTF
ncbi:fibrinogen-binding protein [Reticulomyxa filosa]|uniref:Fibrinogen-binding protein n=1 Tax=Reticulomyxa filosa TaxID=46433 RepID=X6P3K5_RETFI|nr:fibrinogen-binding protein [Reticulomyxa filosa]|eukprot:ETO32786.1 fibrinogen-binding protein [Reticulomyxa filosa]